MISLENETSRQYTPCPSLHYSWFRALQLVHKVERFGLNGGSAYGNTFTEHSLCERGLN